MNFKPMGDWVLLEMVEPDKEAGGIVLSDNAQDRPCDGIVVELGTGVLDKQGNKIEFEVEIGQKVLVPRFGGEDINIEGKKYRQVKSEDIIGVYE